jgi:hypothetical protein
MKYLLRQTSFPEDQITDRVTALGDGAGIALAASDHDWKQAQATPHLRPPSRYPDPSRAP